MARTLSFVLALAVGATALCGLHCNPANGFEEYTPPPPPDDFTAPVFAGVRGATPIDDHNIQLVWDPATDNQSTADQISYLVFISTTADGIDFTKPIIKTPSGATGSIIPGLKAAGQYFVAVRAYDRSNNVDANETVVAVTMPDKGVPEFDGVQKVVGVSATSVRAEWNAARDEGTPAAGIRYAIYISSTSGAQDFKSPPALFTAAGELSGVIEGLTEATKYYVVVRAIDGDGNTGFSSVEVAGTTLDITPPTFGGVTSIAPFGTTMRLDWAAASDLVDPATDLTYSIYQGISAAGIDFTKPPKYSVKGVLTYTATGLDVSTKYFYIVRARDTSGNEDTNLVELSATTAASADTKFPTFGGLVTASAAGKTSIALAWGEANDDYSAPANITYDVYVASSAGGETYTSTTRTTKGASTYTATGLTANTKYYFVVRAKDEAGNEDVNVIEKSATTLP